MVFTPLLPVEATIQWLAGDPDLAGVDIIGGAVDASILARRTISLMPSGGASMGPGARSDAAIGTVRMDMFCYAESGAEAEVLYSAVRDRMLEITQNSDTLLTATISGGPVYGVDSDMRWHSMWGSWLIDHLR